MRADKRLRHRFAMGQITRGHGVGARTVSLLIHVGAVGRIVLWDIVAWTAGGPDVIGPPADVLSQFGKPRDGRFDLGFFFLAQSQVFLGFC